MEQKFIKMEEAVERLGITTERLNALREQGELRAYRDGSSWKFRSDEIQQLITEGIPEPAPPSDIGLVDPESLVESKPLDATTERSDEMKLADDSDLSLSEPDDTVPVETDDLVLETPEEPSDPSDSILLSEEQLGESASGPASTIIGKSDLESEDADLELAKEDSAHDGGSDVRLTSAGASSVLSSEPADSDDVLDALEDEPSISAFEDLEELEIDLAAESSRILHPDEAAKVKDAAKAASAGKKEESDLQLSDLDMAADGSDAEPTDLSSIGLDMSEKTSDEEGSGSEIDLGDSDDFVLADPSGSDLTLDSGDSGINLIDPSDSGLALDDIPLEMGGSAILESLSLGGEGSDPEISLVAGGSSTSTDEPLAELQTDDDFQLTPMGKDDADADDSSSQVIALDDGLSGIGGLGDDAGGLLSEADLVEDDSDAMELIEDDGGDFDVEAHAGAAASTAASAGDYTLWNILSLGSCVLLLTVGSIMMLDMVRNIWSWDETYALNSSILDGLLGIFGLN